MHDAFKLYSKQDQNEIISRNMNKMSEKLATLCSTLGECPNIRYRSDEFNRNKEFAKMLQEKLDAYKNDVESVDPEKSKSTVLILDRGFDTVTPLLHGLTYQDMSYDLLSIENFSEQPETNYITENDVFHYKVDDKDKKAVLGMN